jgi:hypothetical protein
MTELRTTRDVVQALGGPRKLAELLGLLAIRLCLYAEDAA